MKFLIIIVRLSSFVYDMYELCGGIKILTESVLVVFYNIIVVYVFSHSGADYVFS